MGEKSGKTGPDPFPKKRKRAYSVMVRLTPAEAVEIRRQAKAAGVSLARVLLDAWKSGRA